MPVTSLAFASEMPSVHHVFGVSTALGWAGHDGEMWIVFRGIYNASVVLLEDSDSRIRRHLKAIKIEWDIQLWDVVRDKSSSTPSSNDNSNLACW